MAGAALATWFGQPVTERAGMETGGGLTARLREFPGRPASTAGANTPGTMLTGPVAQIAQLCVLSQVPPSCPVNPAIRRLAEAVDESCLVDVHFCGEDMSPP